MAEPFSQHCNADTHDIMALLREVEQAAVERGLSDRTRYYLAVVIEELALNIMKHGYAEHEGSFDFSMTIDSEIVTLLFDDQAHAFNPVAFCRVRPQADSAEPTVGGLGLKLVHQHAKSMSYERRDGHNRLTVVLDRQPDAKG